MTAGVALEVAGAHLGAREGSVPREASARASPAARGPLRAHESPSPRGAPQTYRAQADPEGLRDAARPGQSAAWLSRAHGAPPVQEHFFGRQDTRLPLPDPLAGCPLTRSRCPPDSQLAVAVLDWLTLVPTRSWRRRGALQPPVPSGRGEA